MLTVIDPQSAMIAFGAIAVVVVALSAVAVFLVHSTALMAATNPE